MINKVEEHKRICADMTNLYERKNNDYGDSFSKVRKAVGPNAILVRLYDKIERLNTLLGGTEQKVKDESIDDCFMDLANYCILELIERRIDKGVDFKIKPNLTPTLSIQMLYKDVIRDSEETTIVKHCMIPVNTQDTNKLKSELDADKTSVIFSEPQEITVEMAMMRLVKELKFDRSQGSYYHGWQSNIACIIMDNSNVQHEQANIIAKKFLEHLIGQDNA